MAAQVAEAKAASTAWTLEAMVAAAQQKRKAWDQITAARQSKLKLRGRQKVSGRR